ncbi:MAG: outer membrane protein [Hyphomicrobiales bacterium]
MRQILKSALLASAASTLLATATLAADLPEETVAPILETAPIQASEYDWSGSYVGINLGFGLDSDFDNNFGADSDADTAFIGGGVVGYNHQINRFVLGIEGDLNYTDLDANDVGFSSELDFLGTVTARAGFTPIDRVLTYVEGGYAFGQVDTTTPFGSDENIQSGFVVGAGAEYALTDSILTGLEYNYIDLNDQDFAAGAETDFSGHAVKFNLKYKF